MSERIVEGVRLSSPDKILWTDQGVTKSELADYYLVVAERMLAAVERAGVTHMICHNYRRVPAVVLAKQLIAEGRLGKIRHFQLPLGRRTIQD